MPLIRPTVLFTVILSTIGGMQLFTEPLIFGYSIPQGGTQRQFQTLAMYIYEVTFTRNFQFGASTTWRVWHDRSVTLTVGAGGRDACPCRDGRIPDGLAHLVAAKSEAAMAKFAIFFSYTPEAWNAMLDKPSDRAAAASQVAEAVGGTVESCYWMFGEYDGFVVVEMPYSVSAGAVSVAVSSSGAIARASTHELLDADGRDALLRRQRRPSRPTHRRRADAPPVGHRVGFDVLAAPAMLHALPPRGRLGHRELWRCGSQRRGDAHRRGRSRLGGHRAIATVADALLATRHARMTLPLLQTPS